MSTLSSSAGIGLAVAPRALDDLDDLAARVVVTAVGQAHGIRDVGIGVPAATSLFAMIALLFDGSMLVLLTSMMSLLVAFPVVQLIERARVRAALIAVGADPDRRRDVDVRLHRHHPRGDPAGAVRALQGRSP